MLKLMIRVRNKILRDYIFPKLFKNNEGFYVLDEKWKYLIVLDACRYDYFEKEVKRRELKGKLEYRISRGADTPSWLKENFTNKDCKDIVYVTANPFVNKIFSKDHFYKIIPVWLDGWNDILQTVTPKTMTKFCLEAVKKYPDKRFVFHFIQPHYPFLTLKIKYGGLKRVRDEIVDKQTKPLRLGNSFFKFFCEDVYSEYNEEELKEGYWWNLKLVMNWVEVLVNKLKGTGKIIITSDHGEALGEKLHPLIPIKVYGHHEKIRIPCLVKVPWMVIENEL